MGVIIPYEIITRNKKNIWLRSANINDVKQIIQLSKEVIKENSTLITTIEEFHITEEQQKEIIQIYSHSPSNCMIVAEYNHQIIALLTFQGGALKKYEHHGTIGMIVHKDWRGQGIGKALLTAIIYWAHFHPFIEKLCLEVLASNNNAIELYKKLGFIEEGRQTKQVKLSNGQYDDIVLMGKFL